MKTTILNFNEISTGYQYRIKPNVFLVEGKLIFANLQKNMALNGRVQDFVESIYRPGIFKRVFVVKKNHGLPYITAQAMMNSDPKSTAKLLSIKKTDNLTPMILQDKTILVSCAGSIGIVRLIDKTIEGTVGSQDIIRVVPKKHFGFLYSYLSTRQVYSYLESKIYGSVILRIEPETVANIPMVNFSNDFQESIDAMIQESAKLREDAAESLNRAQSLLKKKANLPILTPNNFDYYGPADPSRKVSTFIRKRKEIDTTTLNAFNYSERVRGLEQMIDCECCYLEDVLLDGEFFTTGSFPRVEVKEKHGIMLINQSDIFDNIIKGKYISKRGVKTNNLVEYGEVMIAGVGTLGENETFCRTIFANEDLEGQLVSGEFLRMKTNGKVPSGYLYAWLSSDYGFRLIRSTQTGTKLCRPIQKLLLKKKIPILDSDSMNEIDVLVREAHTKRHKANQMELKAISMVEQEIEKWSN